MDDLNKDRVFTRVVLAQNGRYAVLARRAEGDDWVQVESVLTSDPASNFADDLESDEAKRADYIEEHEGEEWGDDEPAQVVR
jgi:hypothetical protein